MPKPVRCLSLVVKQFSLRPCVFVCAGSNENGNERANYVRIVQGKKSPTNLMSSMFYLFFMFCKYSWSTNSWICVCVRVLHTLAGNERESEQPMLQLLQESNTV